jgi:hypothetical protein
VAATYVPEPAEIYAPDPVEEYVLEPVEEYVPETAEEYVPELEAAADFVPYARRERSPVRVDRLIMPFVWFCGLLLAVLVVAGLATFLLT